MGSQQAYEQGALFDPANAPFPLRLNPEYWDGRQLLKGELEPEPGALWGVYSKRFAINSIKKVCASGLPEYSLDTYRTGEVFSCDKYGPGTVMVFNRERIYREDNDQMPVDMDNFADQEVPDPPTHLELNLFNQGFLRHGVLSDRAGGVIYNSTVRVGVVTRDLLGNKALVSVHGGSVAQEWGSKRITVTDRPAKEPSKVTIGEVKHFGTKLGGMSEKLSRVNILKVLHIEESDESEPPNRRKRLKIASIRPSIGLQKLS